MFFYHVFKNQPVHFVPFLTRTSDNIQSFISGNRILNSPFTYIMLVLLAPVPTYNAPLDHINTFQQRFFQIILDIFHQIASLIA